MPDTHFYLNVPVEFIPVSGAHCLNTTDRCWQRPKQTAANCPRYETLSTMWMARLSFRHATRSSGISYQQKVAPPQLLPQPTFLQCRNTCSTA